MSYEETVKNKLFELWKKDVMKDNNGWKRMSINLGVGMLKMQGLAKVSKIVDTIQDFGIDMDMLDSMDLGYDELHQLYNHINFYRKSVRYLKKLKTEMARKNNDYSN